MALVVISLTAGLLLLEAGFRLVRRPPWYESVADPAALRKSERYTIGGYECIVRAPLPAESKKDADTYRLLFLGDSFTYGQGIEDASATFAGRITARLNEESCTPRVARYESFNAGVPGSAPHHWVRIYEDAAESFLPDMVVMVFFLRDGTPDLGSIPMIARIREEMNRFVERSFPARHSYVYRFVRERRALARFSKIYLREMNEAYVGGGEATKAWREAQSNVLTIRDRCADRGTGFAFVIFPVLYELKESYPLAPAMEEILRFCRENAIDSLSLLPAFMNLDAPTLWISPLDQHPNERGHQIAAEAIYPYVLERMRAHDPRLRP